MNRALTIALVATTLAAGPLIACGGDKPSQSTAASAKASASARAPAAAAPSATFASTLPDAGADGDGGLPKLELGENDFVESDRNRDPFRSFAAIFVETGKKPTVNQRQVVLGEFALDELKLVAIVLGGDFPRAMLLDPSNKGWVVKRGDYIGRPEVVHTGGANGTDFQVNWRVDRIRDGDIVLTREDPSQAGVAPATRVIPLHPENEKQNRL